MQVWHLLRWKEGNRTVDPAGTDLLWDCEIVRRTLYRSHKNPGHWIRSGLEESGARTAANAKRPKSIVFKGAKRPSLIDFRALTEGRK